VKSTNLIELECCKEIAVLRLNRPEVHNAVNADMMTQWETHLDTIETDSQIRAIIITGKGSDTFCAGGDLKYFASLDTQSACVDMSHRMQAILNRMSCGKKVVVGAINGQALGGGCEICLACHYTIAADHATFAFRQAANGIITGWGGGRRFFKRVGKSSALRLLLTGERINAKDALNIRLIDQVVASEDLLPTAKNLVGKINANSQQSVEAFLKMADIFDNANDQNFIQFEADAFPGLFLGKNFRKILKNYI
jgi:enoyl-CoA hydratase/carnithine racemase